jgi:hypothetical protein
VGSSPIGCVCYLPIIFFFFKKKKKKKKTYIILIGIAILEKVPHIVDSGNRELWFLSRHNVFNQNLWFSLPLAHSLLKSVHRL